MFLCMEHGSSSALCVYRVSKLNSFHDSVHRQMQNAQKQSRFLPSKRRAIILILYQPFGEDVLLLRPLALFVDDVSLPLSSSSSS